MGEVDPAKYTITMVPIVVDGADKLALGGATYAFKEELKERGFSFHNSVNGEDGVQLWLAPADTANKEELEELIAEYGFVLDEYDGVDEDEDEEDGSKD